MSKAIFVFSSSRIVPTKVKEDVEDIADFYHAIQKDLKRGRELGNREGDSHFGACKSIFRASQGQTEAYV